MIRLWRIHLRFLTDIKLPGTAKSLCAGQVERKITAQELSRVLAATDHRPLSPDTTTVSRLAARVTPV
jgi:hypothetical protein